MKDRILFSGNIRENVINVSSFELAKRVVKIIELFLGQSEIQDYSETPTEYLNIPYLRLRYGDTGLNKHPNRWRSPRNLLQVLFLFSK